MSMYGESEYNSQKNDIYDEIKWFLEEHPVSELLRIIADVIEYEGQKYEEGKKKRSSVAIRTI